MFILDGYKIEKEKRYIVFTAPLEVDRELYKSFVLGQSNVTEYTAPREVDGDI